MHVIASTLGYVLSSNRRQALLIHRTAQADDRHYGKYNGLGGKLEPDEDLVTGMHREIREEAGIECSRLELAGTIVWTGIEPRGGRCLGALFRITEWSGNPLACNSEGDLVWADLTDMIQCRLPMWAGDRYFLPLVFADRPRQFHGVMEYTRDVITKWTYSEL